MGWPLIGTGNTVETLKRTKPHEIQNDVAIADVLDRDRVNRRDKLDRRYVVGDCGSVGSAG